MGRRNDDRIPPEVWRERAPFVWLMAAYGWRVTSRCWKCGARRDVDLIALGRELGPQYVLWDRAGRCKQLAACWGIVTFSARPPGLYVDIQLCGSQAFERKKAALDAACKAWLASQPNPDDPRNFGRPSVG